MQKVCKVFYVFSVGFFIFLQMKITPNSLKIY